MAIKINVEIDVSDKTNVEVSSFSYALFFLSVVYSHV